MAKAGRHERQRWPLAVLLVFVLSGFLFVAASVNSNGSDLRPSGDVASLLREREQEIGDRRDEARDLRSDIDTLSSSVKDTALALEMLSLQGQRLISTTGIKCVGNTVVLDGVPYSPPYVIQAIGDPMAMHTALAESPRTISYQDYVDKYQLGLKVEDVDNLAIKAYAGPVGLRFARATTAN